jgi:hypothetical protein
MPHEYGVLPKTREPDYAFLRKIFSGGLCSRKQEISTPKAVVKIVSDQYQRRRHRNTADSFQADSKTPWRTLGVAGVMPISAKKKTREARVCRHRNSQ